MESKVTRPIKRYKAVIAKAAVIETTIATYKELRTVWYRMRKKYYDFKILYTVLAVEYYSYSSIQYYSL